MTRNLILSLVALLLISSCKQNTNSTTAIKDEVKKIKLSSNPPSPCIDSTLIPLTVADSLIYNYHRYKTQILKEKLGYSSFMLNANALREYLNNNPDIRTLNVYLSKNEPGPMLSNSMNLTYIGAIDSLGENDTTYNVERPYFKDGDSTPYFLNHSFPCPTCVDRIEAYTAPN